MFRLSRLASHPGELALLSSFCFSLFSSSTSCSPRNMAASWECPAMPMIHFWRYRSQTAVTFFTDVILKSNFTNQFYCLFCTWTARFCIGTLEDFFSSSSWICEPSRGYFNSWKSAVVSARFKALLLVVDSLDWRLALLCPKSSAAHVGTCFSLVRPSVSELQAKQKVKPAGLFRQSRLCTQYICTWIRNSPVSE